MEACMKKDKSKTSWVGPVRDWGIWIVGVNKTAFMAGFALALAVSLSGFAADDPGETLFKADFEKVPVDKDAGDLELMPVGEGVFKVKQDGDNKFLELAPTPLDTFGLLIGTTETDNVQVQARIFATSSGRRFPVIGVGLNGLGGYILRCNPARKTLEIIKSDEVKKSIPYTWVSGTWTILKLQFRKKEGLWTVQGKAWEQGKTEPAEFLISLDDKEAPTAGRATLWGIPYSATPIRFDDLSVTKLK